MPIDILSIFPDPFGNSKDNIVKELFSKIDIYLKKRLQTKPTHSKRAEVINILIHDSNFPTLKVEFQKIRGDLRGPSPSLSNVSETDVMYALKFVNFKLSNSARYSQTATEDLQSELFNLRKWVYCKFYVIAEKFNQQWDNAIKLLNESYAKQLASRNFTVRPSNPLNGGKILRKIISQLNKVNKISILQSALSENNDFEELLDKLSDESRKRDNRIVAEIRILLVVPHSSFAQNRSLQREYLEGVKILRTCIISREVIQNIITVLRFNKANGFQVKLRLYSDTCSIAYYNAKENDENIISYCVPFLSAIPTDKVGAIDLLSDQVDLEPKLNSHFESLWKSRSIAIEECIENPDQDSRSIANWFKQKSYAVSSWPSHGWFNRFSIDEVLIGVYIRESREKFIPRAFRLFISTKKGYAVLITRFDIPKGDFVTRTFYGRCRKLKNQKMNYEIILTSDTADKKLVVLSYKKKAFSKDRNNDHYHSGIFSTNPYNRDNFEVSCLESRTIHLFDVKDSFMNSYNGKTTDKTFSTRELVEYCETNEMINPNEYLDKLSDKERLRLYTEKVNC